MDGSVRASWLIRGGLVCHILIIEDELFIALDLEALLRKEGATSFSFAQTEAEAVTEALAHRPSLITSDMTLSEGTGPQAVAAIHEALGDIPSRPDEG